MPAPKATRHRYGIAPVGYAKQVVDLGGGNTMTHEEEAGRSGTDQEIWDCLKAIERAGRAYDRALARHGGVEAWDAKKEGRPRHATSAVRASSGGRPNNYTGD